MRERRKQERLANDEKTQSILASWHDNSEARSDTQNVEKAKVLWEMNAFRFSSRPQAEKTSCELVDHQNICTQVPSNATVLNTVALGSPTAKAHTQTLFSRIREISYIVSYIWISDVSDLLMHPALVCFCCEADRRRQIKKGYEAAYYKARTDALHGGQSEATHSNIVEFYGCFLVLNVLAFFCCLKHLLASMS